VMPILSPLNVIQIRLKTANDYSYTFSLICE
ncbi:MAG: hypothetical protein ACI90V_001383, partial [Bacillariaceae sp.]